MYDKLIVSEDLNITIKAPKKVICSIETDDIYAIFKDYHGNPIKNEQIYFYVIDTPPEIDEKHYVSINGEIICDEYLPEGNPVNPESSFGWFIYMIIGGGFDRMDEMTSTFLNDCSPISANPKSLDRFYGASLQLPRPTILDGNVERLLTDEEYAVYLYLRNSRLLTKLDLLSVFGHCMGDEDSDDVYNGVTVTDERNAQWWAVDHLHYTSPSGNPSSNIGKNSNSDLNHIVNHDSEEDVYVIPGQQEYTGEMVTVVNVPNAGWSSAFLDFLTDYISIKGNVLVREVVR